MAKGFTDDDDALLAELGIEIQTKEDAARTPREERIIAGFEEIQRFVAHHGRAPQHGEGRDIFERLYAVRLDRLRAQADCRALLAGLDEQGLLTGAELARVGVLGGPNEDVSEDISDDELLTQLGVDVATSAPAAPVSAASDITTLRHVRSAADKRVAEEIANQERCEDFDRFKPMFQAIQKDINTGARITQPIRKDAGFLKTDIKAGEFFILGGQITYVADVGEPFKAPNGENDARLRTIYANGTESNLLLRSLQRALYKDDGICRVSEPDAGPLFAATPFAATPPDGEHEADDLASGTLYVLRSQADHPTIAANRAMLHKIGVTGGDVARRIAHARMDPTFLMDDVEIVATYTLYNINRTRLERLIHRIFGPARLDITIKDRFGQAIVPREWFLVPVSVIDDAVEKIRDGTIVDYIYDPAVMRLVLAGSDGA